MRGRTNWAWAALVLAASAGPAAAQTGGIGSGGSTGAIGLGGGGGLTSGGLTSSGLAGTLNSSNVGGGSGVGAGGLSTNRSGTGGSGGTSQTPLATNGISPPTGNSRSSLDSSNIFSGFYANPMYAGSSGQGGVGVAPGGFGSPLYTGTTGSGATGARGGRAGTTGASLGAGGMGGRGGLGSTNTFGALSGSSQTGIVVPIPVQINSAAQIQFSAPPVAAPRLQADLRNALDNSSLLPNGRDVLVITDAQNNVTLRGRVRDENEARLIEGVVRLTPGVRVIQNELTFDAAASK
jgi:hypothetical protein